MQAIKKFLGKDDGSDCISIQCPSSLQVEVNVSGVLPYSSSSLFITCFAKFNGKKTDVPVAVKYKWYRMIGNTKYPLTHTSSTYFVTALDIFSKLLVEVESLEADLPGTATVTVGPILLDHRIKLDLYEIASKSDGIMLPLLKLEPGRDRHTRKIEKPHLYIFETYIKIVGQCKDQLRSLRINFRDNFEFKPCPQGPTFLRLMPPEGKTADFFECQDAEGDGIDLEFESIYFRDRAILSMKVYSVIQTLRNELILQKILPLITNSQLDVNTKSAELIGINDALIRELTRLYNEKVYNVEKVQQLEDELTSLRKLSASTNYMPSRGKASDEVAMHMSGLAMNAAGAIRVPNDLNLSNAHVLEAQYKKLDSQLQGVKIGASQRPHDDPQIREFQKRMDEQAKQIASLRKELQNYKDALTIAERDRDLAREASCNTPQQVTRVQSNTQFQAENKELRNLLNRVKQEKDALAKELERVSAYTVMQKPKTQEKPIRAVQGDVIPSKPAQPQKAKEHNPWENPYLLHSALSQGSNTSMGKSVYFN